MSEELTKMFQELEKATEKTEIIAMKYQKYAKISIFMMFILVGFLASLLSVNLFLLPKIEWEVEEYLRDKNLQFMVYAIHVFLLLLSSTILHYSLRQEEKYQQNYFTFMRIRIALAIPEDQSDTVVKKALIRNLFAESILLKSMGKHDDNIQSGHPVVDRCLEIINNLTSKK